MLELIYRPTTGTQALQRALISSIILEGDNLAIFLEVIAERLAHELYIYT